MRNNMESYDTSLDNGFKRVPSAEVPVGLVGLVSLEQTEVDVRFTAIDVGAEAPGQAEIDAEFAAIVADIEPTPESTEHIGAARYKASGSMDCAHNVHNPTPR